MEYFYTEDGKLNRYYYCNSCVKSRAFKKSDNGHDMVLTGTAHQILCYCKTHYDMLFPINPKKIKLFKAL